MDAALFAKIISDPAITDWKKLKYKYPSVDLKELSALMKKGLYSILPLPDFKGTPLVAIKHLHKTRSNALKKYLMPRTVQEKYGNQAMEDEITSTLTIENIDFSRQSVRKILEGYAPVGHQEERIAGLKKGYEFISNPQNTITEISIHKLYITAIEPYLESSNDQLLPNRLYRHDNVFITGLEIEHVGLSPDKLAGHMEKLLSFIHSDNDMDDLSKAAAIHFYLAYLHPYFDGNGRMARLLHLWYLVQRGYPSTLFIPISSYIEKSRQKYYKAYSQIESNESLSGVIDITPFLMYFNEFVYEKATDYGPSAKTLDDFTKLLQSGELTAKEHDLWNYILTAYGNNEFSTKQLERDYGNAAYATIRSFVIKLSDLGILTVQPYKNRKKYRIRLD